MGRQQLTLALGLPEPSASAATFYLGAHQPGWLGLADVPLFVSAPRIWRRSGPLVPRVPWALDSGGFSELSRHGAWRTRAHEYAAVVRRAQSWGLLRWAAPQDWMCEPQILARTGLSVAEHQQRTIVSVLELRDLGVPVIPVLQGWQVGDYLRHADAYLAAGIDLTNEPVVGVGTVCRRQDTSEAEWLIRRLHADGLRLHGFGVKIGGLRRIARCLVSADSMAWSFGARRRKIRLSGCTHQTCANCLRYAQEWRAALVTSLGGAIQ